MDALGSELGEAAAGPVAQADLGDTGGPRSCHGPPTSGAGHQERVPAAGRAAAARAGRPVVVVRAVLRSRSATGTDARCPDHRRAADGRSPPGRRRDDPSGRDQLPRHELPAPGDSTAALVRTVMARTAGGPAGASLEQVAGLLALHPRTLQRRLAEEGTGFDHLRDEALRELAHQYLTESSLAMSHVVLAPGFSEQSALTPFGAEWSAATRNRGCRLRPAGRSSPCRGRPPVCGGRPR